MLGGAFLFGGLKHHEQEFNSANARTQAGMLLLATIALVVPSAVAKVDRVNAPTYMLPLSLGLAGILLVTYALGLLFSLKTHRDVFNPDTEHEDVAAQAWSIKKSVGLLAGAGVAVGVMSEILVGSIEAASEGIGLSPFFVSLIIVAIVGNAAEHWVAVYFASRNKMDIAIAIAVGSSAQIALFVMPVLVLLSFLIGPFPLSLEFSGLEIGAILLAVLLASHVSQDGESTWFEGVQLLAVYVVLGIVFYFV